MRRYRLTFLASGLLLGMVAALFLYGSSGASPTTYIRVAGSYPDYTGLELAGYADVVAIISPVAEPTLRWNSSDNTPWALEALGTESHIYRDQLVTVDRALRGRLPADVLVLRSVGGRLGDIEIEYEDAAKLQLGEKYLAFLKLVDTPTREGFEPAWVVVRHSHGLFQQTSDGVWSNAYGRSITEGDLVGPGG